MFDEMSHATALESAIVAFGAEPISNCQFNFDSVLTDVPTTVAAARLVEHVGVGAYLGAANLLSDPRFVQLEGSGEHQAVAWAVRGDGKTHVLNQL